MLASPLLALAVLATPAGCPAGGLTFRDAPRIPISTAHQDSLAALYERGETWAAFLEGVSARRDTWVSNYAEARVDSALVARVNQVPGRWRFLVIAEDWCGDSANTIPFLARLVELAERLDLRVVKSDPGRWVMEAHRTEDGRAATPTVVLLDETWTERGCWVERPYALRTVVAEVRAGQRQGGLVEVITAWRREDRGQSTLGDLASLLESAAAGTPRCP